MTHKRYEPRFDNSRSRKGEKPWYVDLRGIGHGRHFHATKDRCQAECDEWNSAAKDIASLSPFGLTLDERQELLLLWKEVARENGLDQSQMELAILSQFLWRLGSFLRNRRKKKKAA